MQNGTKLEEFNYQAGFAIFTFNLDIIYSLSLYVLLQGSHSIAMFATHVHALRECNNIIIIIATYIRIIRS